VLGWPHVDSGDGWLIFRTGPSELGVHPTAQEHDGQTWSTGQHHEIALICDDIAQTVADLTAKVHAVTGQTAYTTRQAAYDLKKLRGKHLVDKPGRTRRYHVQPTAVRAVTAVLTLREKVIAPLVAGVRDDLDHTPGTCTRIDRDYQRLRADMRVLFDNLGITTAPAAA